MLLRKDCVYMALAVLCGALISLPTNAVEVESNSIPGHLQDCYQNDSLYHRENRLSSTMDIFVGIIRQIEESPGFTMDMRSFTLSLLHMFRVDGVERDPDVVAAEHTIPFGLTGTQYYKYKLLMNGLIPRSSFLFPNETLTDSLKCTLHFMLSNSLDKHQRGDERDTCLVAQYRASATQRRNRRNVDYDDEVESVPQSGGDSTQAADDQNHSAPVADNAPIPNNPEAEILNIHSSKELSAAGERKGDLMWNQDGIAPPSNGQMRNAPAVAARLETSDCPVENGVVYARWGTVQLGAVLAGIATGFETQLVQIKDLRKSSSSKFTDPTVLNGVMEVDNRYAATLAGDLAEVALWRGPKGDYTVGASGNWNSTQSPRWYFIQGENEMTDAEIRGGLDGLIMAYHVKEWNRIANGQLKLSTVLERYYSKRGIIEEEYRACDRQSHYKTVAPKETIKTQTTNFGYILYDRTPTMATIKSEGVSEYAANAFESLDRTIRESSQMEATCQTMGRSSDEIIPSFAAHVNFIVDCQWPHDQVHGMLESLGRNMDLHPQRSSLTVYGAKQQELLFNTTNRLQDLLQNLQTNKSEYEQCAQGVDMKELLTKLQEIYYLQLENDKETGEASVQSQVVVIMPFNTYSLQGEESQEVENLIKDYRERFPDVTFLIFTSQNNENIQVLVENPDTDIILATIQSNEINVEPLIARLNREPRRIANPTCGNEWKSNNYNSLTTFDYVPLKLRNLYRINPKYLYGAGKVVIKIQEQNKGTVKICHSRESFGEIEDSNEDDDSIECEEINNKQIEIELRKPCGNTKSYLTCSPLYISVQAQESKNNCNENLCKDFDDVGIAITHEGLTCSSLAVLANPLILVATIVASVKSIL